MWQVCPPAENLSQQRGRVWVVSSHEYRASWYVHPDTSEDHPVGNDLPNSLDEPSSKAPHEYHEATQNPPVTRQLLTSGVLPPSAA